MWFAGYVVVLFTASTGALPTNFTPKCCDEHQEVDRTNASAVSCTNKTSSRYEILSESSRFLVKNSTGECVDVNNNQFFAYNVREGEVVETKPAKTEPFTKCCPLNYIYNTTSHSCIESVSSTLDFIPEQLVRIGLPECHIIIDKKLGKYYDLGSLRLREKDRTIFCIDKDTNNEFIRRECQTDFNICNQKRCIKKCCADGQSFVGGGICKDTFVRGIEIKDQLYSPYIESPEDDYQLIYKTGCSDVVIYPTNTLQYSIDKNGIFKYYSNYTGEFILEEPTDLNGYCIEHATTDSMQGHYMFRCFIVNEVSQKFVLTLWAKILSSILLLVTVGIYLFLGEVRNTFGKILVSYCTVMFMLMVTLIVSITTAVEIECKIRGYLLILFTSSTHAWVNVMSYDIWSTFVTPKKAICVTQKQRDVRQFLLYCCYAWGLAFFHMILLIVLESTTFLPDSIQPRIGHLYCFIENVNYGRIVFFLLPYLILQTINAILFVKTLVYCIKVRNEIERMNNPLQKQENGKFFIIKDRLGLIVKLAVIMGVIWVIEMVTTFFNNMKRYSDFTKTLEIILDTITCCQGIFIFLIFICKKRTVNMIKMKLGWGSRRDSTSATPSSEVNGHIAMNRGQTPVPVMNAAA